MSAKTAGTLPDGPDYLHLLLILYGSAKGDSSSDDRFGQDQRRAEVDIRLKLPRAGMRPPEIDSYAREFVGLNYASIKHTQKWHCEFCDKPARMSQQDAASWSHLKPPRSNLYFHFVCDPSTGPCAAQLRSAHIQMASMTGRPPQPPGPRENPLDFPPMAVCAGCQREETVDVPTKKCSGCDLTRSVDDFKNHWREHKAFCKTPKTVKWVWP
ncbi:uncharacterized protein B0H18DRAFT_365383 [Fomitopsis serialis]|uniref:uncharacterized protein n=1 Tax=Fomitopsis serialis TaxID=139415 RepID=UPI00200892E8|nr:uncharacterized protein B0H18DRAFT_365383 [Neoantrodia serialis]KAH9925738.1 hypothetical protein B0H18DRAFT_365383 [Neoantrodia serialis]